MGEETYSRRKFLKTIGASGIMAAFGEFDKNLFAEETRRFARFPEKTDLVLLTSRPPQLETPLEYFKDPITPNKALFVRWHLSNLQATVDLAQWRLRIGGATKRKIELSMDDLKRKFKKFTYAAVIQCSGNGRSFFEPRIPGGQWQHGSMGNVMWSGVRLRDVLNEAGLQDDAGEIAFNGLDTAPMASVPDYVKSLPVDKALEDDVIIAYEMNGEPLLMLNGFPARLVVPGWYATYWVKALSEISVLSKGYEGFWMKQAYRIPDTPCACVAPGTQPSRTVPNSRMNTKSVVIQPLAKVRLEVNKSVEIVGVAFSGGYNIKEVLVSLDRGRNWSRAALGKDLGRYSWVQWLHSWRPLKPGKYTIMAKATNSIGESQPFEPLWNPSGYMWNKVESIEVIVGRGI